MPVRRTEESEEENETIKEEEVHTNKLVHSIVDPLRELLETKIDKNFEIAREKFQSIDDVIEFSKRTINANFQTHATLDEERFKNVYLIMATAERVARESVDASLGAARSAAATQMEAATKSHDQLSAKVDVIAKSLEDRISDLKDRVVAMEAKKAGGSEQLALILALVATAVSLGVFILSFLREGALMPTMTIILLLLAAPFVIVVIIVAATLIMSVIMWKWMEPGPGDLD